MGEKWTASTREAMYKAFREGKGTRDMAGAEGLTTEGFVAEVRKNLDAFMAADGLPAPWTAADVQKPAMSDDIDVERMRETFNFYDKDGDDSIDFEEFVTLMDDLGLAPKTKEAHDQEALRKLAETV